MVILKLFVKKDINFDILFVMFLECKNNGKEVKWFFLNFVSCVSFLIYGIVYIIVVLLIELILMI